MNKRFWIIILAIIVVILLIGQAIVYYANPYSASIDIKKVSDDKVEYNYSTNISLDCNIISLSMTCDVSSYYAFYDSNYPTGPGVNSGNVKNYLDWMRTQMSRNGIDLTFISGSEVKELMISEKNCAIIFAMGALPDTVYKGNSDDLIFKWLKNGGVMYWVNGKIGQYCSGYGIEDCMQIINSDHLFFGVDGVVRSSTEEASSRIFKKNSMTDLLDVNYSECTNGLKVDKLNTPYLTMDNNVEGYYSVSLCKYYGGTGCICVFGGDLNYDMLVSILQVIESKISYSSEIIDYSIVSGSKKGVLNIRSGGCVFSFIGEMESVWRHNDRV